MQTYRVVGVVLALIDVDALRDYMEDEYGTAMMSGMWPALGDLGAVSSMDGRELCELAEQQGIDLEQFVVDE